MKRTLFTTCALLLCAPICSAGFVVNIGGVELTQGGSIATLSESAVSVEFEDVGFNQVEVTMTANALDPTIQEWWWSKGKELYFNSAAAFRFDSHLDGVVAKATQYRMGNGKKWSFAGGSKFDVKVTFDPSGSGQFSPPAFSKYLLVGTDASNVLTAQSFNTGSSFSLNGTDLDLYAALHINNVYASSGQSGKYGSTSSGDNFVAVPEPTAIAMWSLCCGLGLFACRRRRKFNA